MHFYKSNHLLQSNTMKLFAILAICKNNVLNFGLPSWVNKGTMIRSHRWNFHPHNQCVYVSGSTVAVQKPCLHYRGRCLSRYLSRYVCVLLWPSGVEIDATADCILEGGRGFALRWEGAAAHAAEGSLIQKSKSKIKDFRLEFYTSIFAKFRNCFIKIALNWWVLDNN